MKRNFIPNICNPPIASQYRESNNSSPRKDSAEPESKGNNERKNKGPGGWGAPSLSIFCGLFWGFFYCVLQVGLKKCRLFISGSYKYSTTGLQQQPSISRKCTTIFFSSYQHHRLLYKSTTFCFMRKHIFEKKKY